MDLMPSCNALSSERLSMARTSYSARADAIAGRHAREVYRQNGKTEEAKTIATQAYRLMFERAYDGLNRRDFRKQPTYR